MSNTIDKTTDADLLRSILDGSIEELEDDTITTLSKPYIFYGLNNLTRLSLPNLKTITVSNVFQGSNSYMLPLLKQLDLPNLDTILNTNAPFSYMRIEELNIPKLRTNNGGELLFLNLSHLKKAFFPSAENVGFFHIFNVHYIVLPSVINMHNCRYCTEDYTDPNLKGIDLGESCTTLTPGSDSFFYQTRCQNIEALILRGNTLVPLTKSLGGAGGTQNFGISAKNRIYVPAALVDEYKNATNWSSYSNIILPIEGSKYEHYWVDGTPICFTNGTGLIGWYEVGNVDDWDSETKTISSHVENEFGAWRVTGYGQYIASKAANIPSLFYDNCYAKGGFHINFGKPLKEISDILTFEFIFCSTHDSGINAYVAYDDEINATNISGYIGTSMRQFRHVIIEIHNDSTGKIYIDKIVKHSNINTNNMFNRQSFGIRNDNGCYIGHVAVWNRELSSEEIAQHYDYYVDNYHVGELAYDENGNFIAGS